MPRAPNKPPKRMTEAKLEASCIFYLARFATASANLRRVLARKVERSAAFHGDDPAPLLAYIDTLVERFQKNGTLDDTRYAETQAAKLRRRGGSARVISGKLAAKGLTGETVSETLATDDPTVERAAAAAYARRRRLGPYRTDEREENRMRDMATMGRGGFDFRTAALIIDAADLDALAEMLNPE